MSIFKNPGIIIRASIAVGYILLSILIFFSPISTTVLSENMKYAFSALLMAYGIFRSYRAFQLYKNLEE
jgi:hypothetical protein